MRVDVRDVLADRDGTVLRRERVTPDPGQLHLPDLDRLAQIADRGAVLDKLGRVELLVVEEVPPLGSLLAAMPADTPREQLVPGIDETLGKVDLGALLSADLSQWLGDRPRERVAASGELGPTVLEPVVQCQRGPDVLLVVSRDVIEDGLVGG